MNRRMLIALPLLPAARPALAHSLQRGAIAIGHAWALPTRESDGQAFFPLFNRGSKPDGLVAARSGICSLVELRRNNRYDDPPLAAIDLEPGVPVPMRPAARHLRLLGLVRPLEVGQSFTMILDFLYAGEAEIEVVAGEP